MSSALLLSGGMDSVALAAWRLPTHVITVDYGQKPAPGEIRAAKQVASILQLNHHIITVDCRSLGSGDLAGTASLSVAPVTEWWPYRNQMLVTFASMKAISLGVTELICGSVKTDGEHADGTPLFYDKIDQLTSMQEGHIRIAVPAIELTTTELIRKSGVDVCLLAWSHSCHKHEYACGNCRGCRKRNGVLAEIGYRDVTAEIS